MGAEWADTVRLSKSERLKMALTELAMLESLLDGHVLTSTTLALHFRDRLGVSGLEEPAYTRHASSFEEYVEQAIQLGTLNQSEDRCISLSRIGELRLNYLRRERIPSLQ